MALSMISSLNSGPTWSQTSRPMSRASASEYGNPAARLMPAQLMELMRHESIETTLRFYVGTDARAKAEAAWAAFEALQQVFAGPFANSAPSGRVDTAPPEKPSAPGNTDRNQTRPGVIRTHDQGIMSPDSQSS